MTETAPSQLELVRKEFGKRVPYWEDVYLDERHWDADAKMRLEITRDFVQKHVPTEGASALDVGCGVGVYLSELSQMGFVDLTGVDITPEMIDRAQALWPKLSPGAESPTWVVSELENLTSVLAAGKFDLAVCAGLFEYLTDDGVALEALHTLMTSGGFLVLTIPNSRALTPVQLMINMKAAWNKIVPGKLRIPSAAAYVRKRYRLRAFLRFAESQGFEPVEWRGHGHALIPFFTSLSLVKAVDDRLGSLLDRLGFLSGFRWLQHTGTNYVVVLKSR